MAAQGGELGESVRTLFDTFWSPQGWKLEPEWPEPERFARAIAAGTMFAEPRSASHDDVVESVRALAARMDPRAVADAFVASLTTRRLDHRSALGSYAIATHLPKHRFQEMREPGHCGVCGLHKKTIQDLNVLNFERLKWGGVRRDDCVYIAFDLEQFSRGERVAPDPDALALGRTVLATLRGLPGGTSASQAALLLNAVPGNKAEREVLLDILGVCGILAPAAHPGYSTQFVEYRSRELPDRRFVDRAYPVCWWTASDRVADAAVREVLPSLFA